MPNSAAGYIENLMATWIESTIRMSRLDEDVQLMLQKYIDLLKKRFGSRLVSVALFGSVARGTAHFPESDVDILLVIEGLEGISLGSRLDMLLDVHREFRGTAEYTRFKQDKGCSPSFQEHVLTSKELLKHPPILLDLITDSIIFLDRGVLKKELEAIRFKLKELGAVKVRLQDGSWYWNLKPTLKLGEEVQI